MGGEGMSYIEMTDVVKEYAAGELAVRALDGVSLHIEEGELVLFLGDSGAGKSTLLNILGGLDTLTSGDITVSGVSLKASNRRAMARYRRRSVGFVFQFYNLISSLTALENVRLVRNMTDAPLDGLELLRYLGMEERKSAFPAQLSGGEQQRVAIARALCKNPELLLCDEPTGALDYQNSRNILALIQKVNREQNRTTVIVTHNNAIEPMADKVVRMKSGKILEVHINHSPRPIAELEW